MEVIIGIDPRKGSHTATMLDRAERELGRMKVHAGGHQVDELLEWANGVRPRTWAVESAGRDGLSALPAVRRRRRAGAGCAGDVGVTGAGVGHRPVDQEGSERCPVGGHRGVAGSDAGGGAAGGSRPTVCRLLAKRHTDVARWRTKLCCRLHALVGELVPGGIDKELVVSQARSLLEGIQSGDLAAVERHHQAVELVAEIEHLDVVVRDSRARITVAVTASGTT